MAKIVGKEKQYVYQSACMNCASIVEYTQNETVMKKGSDYSGYTRFYDALTCPGCGKEIEV